MLDSGKKIRALRDQKNILTLVTITYMAMDLFLFYVAVFFYCSANKTFTGIYYMSNTATS
jgi:hypothetical protein